MLLDSSAVIAVMLREPGRGNIRDRINAADTIAISAVTLFETYLVLTNKTGRDASPLLDAFTLEIGVQIIPFTESHWRVAAEGFLHDGKGKHPAGLNFGDCMVYATARLSGMPLLFKGDDFKLTDVAAD